MSALDDLKKLFAEAAELQKKKLEQTISVTQETIPINEDAILLPEEESIAQKTARYLNTNNDNIPAKPENIEKQRWNGPPPSIRSKFCHVQTNE